MLLPQTLDNILTILHVLRVQHGMPAGLQHRGLCGISLVGRFFKDHQRQHILIQVEAMT